MGGISPAQLQAYIIFLHNATPPGSLGDAFFNGGASPSFAGVLQTVNTIASLRALSPPQNGTPILVLGYNTAGDKTWTGYTYDTSSTGTDDGGSIIKPTSVSGAGRWIQSL